jgi:hypothetical protein
METREDRIKTVRSILEASYGTCLTYFAPKKYRDMEYDEREALLLPHKGNIEQDIAMINEVLEAESSYSVGEALSVIRNAEGMDSDMIDEIMEYSGDPGEYPIED